jgi:RNA polymerase sigma-70 factor (ECF subfamily)
MDEEQQEWMRRWAAGDGRGGDRLTQALFPLVRSYARRRLPEEQEDVVQDTFLRLAANVRAGTFRGESTVRSYVLGIARYVVCERLGARTRGRRFDPVESSLRDATGRRLSSLLGALEKHQLVLDALEDIVFEDHEILEMHYMMGLTGGEIAAVLNVPEGTVRSRIHRAMVRLRARIEEGAAAPHALETSEDVLERWLRELGLDPRNY